MAICRAAMEEQIRSLGPVHASIHSRIIRYQIILEMTGRPVHYALEMSDRYWDAFLRGLEAYPGTAECLHSLRTAGHLVGIGTNMTAEYQYRKLDRMGLLDQIDFMLTSEEAGADKPDSRFFARCLDKAGCNPAECVFVGDKPAHDVLAPLREGMRAVWFRVDPSTAVPEGLDAVPQTASLKDLPALLAKW